MFYNSLQFTVYCFVDAFGNKPEKQYWPSHFTYLITSISAIVGLGDFWYFPALCSENGGGE